MLYFITVQVRWEKKKRKARETQEVELNQLMSNQSTLEIGCQILPVE